MRHKSSGEARFRGALAFLLLLGVCVAAVAQPEPMAPRRADGYGTSNVLTGVVQNVNRSLNYVTVRDDATGRAVKIDVRSMDTRRSINVWQLRAGDRVNANGAWSNNNTFRADRVTVGTNAPLTSAPGALRGTVQSINRRLNYITVIDQATRRDVKIDVRDVDMRQSANVWQLRAGDSVVVNGSWSSRDTYRADRVDLATSRQGNGSRSANRMTGTVESVNRSLNYVTIRDDATGQSVKVDVRRMDTRRSVNVWQLHNGDRVKVNGAWGDRDRFEATTVNF
ncbi:MAG TPA: hypothetical protein VF980_12825 [Thermoanaerobaculia bacterium]